VEDSSVMVVVLSYPPIDRFDQFLQFALRSTAF